MALSLLYAPLLLKYLGVESYGIWATVLNIINWISLADIGIGNGLRNILSINQTNEDVSASKTAVSTAYICLSIIVLGVFILGVVIGDFFNWNAILNTSIEVKGTLFISFLFMCINLVLSLQKNGFFAINKAEITSVQTIMIQVANILGVLLLTHLSFGTNSLFYMGVLFGVTGLTVNLLFSGLLWTRYPYYKPNLNKFEKSQLTSITSLGFKFFFIQIAVMVLFTTDNIIISNLYSPTLVTPYNTVYKAYGVFNSLFIAFLAPLWNKYTEAYEKKDYIWIGRTINKAKKVWIIMTIIMTCTIPFYEYISLIWMRQKLNYENHLVLLMVIYYILYSYSGIYSVFFNGIGKVNYQMIVAIFTAIINIPLSVFFAKHCKLGTAGVCLGTVICLLLTDIAYSVYANIFVIQKYKNGDNI